jgi:hypothetical protein
MFLRGFSLKDCNSIVMEIKERFRLAGQDAASSGVVQPKQDQYPDDAYFSFG